MLMDILQVPLFFFLFLSLVHSKKHCPSSYCGNNNSFRIQYPFKLQGQQLQNCSYTDLKCNSQGTAVLNLPYSGDFFVRYIDYTYSVIQLYDPENCLPKRFMSFNLLSSGPFLAVRSQNYTFYSCPPELIQLSNLTSIDCLSNSSTAIVATSTLSSQVMEKLYRCNETATSLVPVSGPNSHDFLGNQTDFFLFWIAPPCPNCPIETGLVPEKLVEAAFVMISFVTVILPSVICIACCVHFIIMFRKESKTENSNS